MTTTSTTVSTTATETRQSVEEQYSMTGKHYDNDRLVDPRGKLLSEHDRSIFNQMFPTSDPSMKIFEFGAGTGRFTIPALERGVSVVATDINESLLEELRAKVRDGGYEDRCEVRKEDVFNLPFEDNTFDVAFGLHIIPRFLTIDDQRAALKEVARVIKPGGKMFFNYRGAKSFYSILHKGNMSNPRDIREELEQAGMRITHQKGKWLLNRALINRIPIFMSKGIAVLDRGLHSFATNHAWDIFVVAQKKQ